MSLESSALNSLKFPSQGPWPQICVTGNETTLAALVARISRVLAEDPTVICEARIDYLQLSPEAWPDFLSFIRANFSPQEMRRILITLRRQDSGVAASGNCSWPLETWFTGLAKLALSDCFWGVDIDWRKSLAAADLPKPKNTKIILSWHGDLSEMHAIFSPMLRLCEAHGFWLKLAAPVNSAADLNLLAQFSARARKIRQRSAFIAMGAAGRAWRWSTCGGALSYFAATAAQSTAPGQSFWHDVKPYWQRGITPQLFGLIGADENNLYGEIRWNRLFTFLQWNHRYVALAFLKSELTKIWPKEMLSAMSWMGLRGASVTMPFKQAFVPAAINTIKRSDHGWKLVNTDGIAVVTVLKKHLSAEDCNNACILIFGGGGASQGVISALQTHGFRTPKVQRRNITGQVSLPKNPASVWIITWPAPLAQELLQMLHQSRSQNSHLLPKLVINATLDQTSNTEWEAWCESKAIAYIGGKIWWSGQARRQFQYWFTHKDRQKLQKKLLSLLPRSKSETLRTLVFAWASGRKLKIIEPAIGDDTHHLENALQLLGPFNGKQARAKAPNKPILIGEGATGFRFLTVLWGVFGEGELLLETTGKLSERNHDDLLRVVEIQRISANQWRILGGTAQLDRLSAQTTSQVASAQIIAAAAMIARGYKKSHIFQIGEILISEPYIRMTEALLATLGFTFKTDKSAKRLTLLASDEFVSQKAANTIHIHYDASALPFLDILNCESGLGELALKIDLGAQGDKKFGALFSKIRKVASSHKISLLDIPDLAPPLLAAAILWRCELQFINAGHLREKESDRLKALVELANAVGCIANETPDGLYLDARSYEWRNVDILVKTYGDHRIAMAAGVLKLRWPRLRVDNPDCVAKSFPNFWRLLDFFTETWL